MPEIIFCFYNFSRLYDEIHHSSEVKHLEAHSSQDNAKTQVPYKRKFIEHRHTLDIVLAHTLLSNIKMLIGSPFYILFGIEQINPESIAFFNVLLCFEFDFHLYPFIECHGEDEGKESDDVEDADEEETISDNSLAGLIEFIE